MGQRQSYLLHSFCVHLPLSFVARVATPHTVIRGVVYSGFELSQTHEGFCKVQLAHSAKDYFRH